LFYIGETQNKLHQRLNGHRDAVRKVRKGQKLNDEINDTGAALHFSQADHDFNKDLEVQIVEAGRWETPLARKEKESYWICFFKTYGEGGLNKTRGNFASLYGKI
jgi:hypothetical protein